jgi:hypothetical protein
MTAINQEVRTESRGVITVDKATKKGPRKKYTGMENHLEKPLTEHTRNGSVVLAKIRKYGGGEPGDRRLVLDGFLGGLLDLKQDGRVAESPDCADLRRLNQRKSAKSADTGIE